MGHAVVFEKLRRVLDRRLFNKFHSLNGLSILLTRGAERGLVVVVLLDPGYAPWIQRANTINLKFQKRIPLTLIILSVYNIFMVFEYPLESNNISKF